MKRTRLTIGGIVLLIASGTTFSCGPKAKIDEAAAAPPQTSVVTTQDVNVIQVDRPERFTLVTAGQRQELQTLNVTGVVNPDITREIPVVSLASGRVVDIRARVGDVVKKGQLLLRILSDDISVAFQNYNHAKADEALARTQLERADLLYKHGAISLNDLQIAQNAEQKAKTDLDVAIQHIRTIGGNIDHEDPIISIYAPITGVIIDQQVTQSANVKTPDNQAAGLFTIADLSRVWIICDVFENDLSFVKVGLDATVRLNAYPDRVFHARVGNIGSILDPSIRTAKVRLEVANPGLMNIGLFATATFYGGRAHTFTTLPATAILHLHDRDWVYVPEQQSSSQASSQQSSSPEGTFRRINVTAGRIASDNSQDVTVGLAPGQKVVSNPLALSAENSQ